MSGSEVRTVHVRMISLDVGAGVSAVYEGRAWETLPRGSIGGFSVSLILSHVGANPEVGVASLSGIVVLRQRGLRSEACRRDRHCDVRRSIVVFLSEKRERARAACMERAMVTLMDRKDASTDEI